MNSLAIGVGNCPSRRTYVCLAGHAGCPTCGIPTPNLLGDDLCERSPFKSPPATVDPHRSGQLWGQLCICWWSLGVWKHWQQLKVVRVGLKTYGTTFDEVIRDGDSRRVLVQHNPVQDFSLLVHFVPTGGNSCISTILFVKTIRKGFLLGRLIQTGIRSRPYERYARITNQMPPVIS